jgi:hypothetical protein
MILDCRLYVLRTENVQKLLVAIGIRQIQFRKIEG